MPRMGTDWDQQEAAEIAEGLRSVVALLERTGVRFPIPTPKGQLITTCVTPAPVNETNRLVHFYICSAREAEAVVRRTRLALGTLKV